jgi:uncharacterized membrane protein
MSTKIALIVGCIGMVAAVPVATPEVAPAAAAQRDEIATLSTLPTFGRGGIAVAIDEAGTFIAGYAWDEAGLRHAVEWTLQSDGSWAVTDLPWPPGATRPNVSGVNNRGDWRVTTSLRRPLTPCCGPRGTSAPLILNCPTDLDSAIVYGISADAQVLVGNGLLTGQGTSVAAVWRPGICREDLPLLFGQGSAAAHAVNADGTIAAGGATGGGSPVAVRWTNVAGEWRIEQLDTRFGEVRGANASGDLAGYVMTPCSREGLCQRAIAWYTTGASRELGTLGGRTASRSTSIPTAKWPA